MKWLRGWRLILATLALLVSATVIAFGVWLTDTSDSDRIRGEAQRLGFDLKPTWPPGSTPAPDIIAALVALTDLPRPKPPIWDKGAPTESLRVRQAELTPGRVAELADIVTRLGHHPEFFPHRVARAIWLSARQLVLERIYVADVTDLKIVVEASLASVADWSDGFMLAHALACRIDDVRRVGVESHAFEPLTDRLLDAYSATRIYEGGQSIRGLLERGESALSEERFFKRWMGEPIAFEILHTMAEHRDQRDPFALLQRWRAVEAPGASTMLTSRGRYARWLVAQEGLRGWSSHVTTIMAIDAVRAELFNLPPARDWCDHPGAMLKPLVHDGVVIGAYSIGMNQLDDGGDHKLDLILPLTPAAAAPMSLR